LEAFEIVDMVKNTKK